MPLMVTMFLGFAGICMLLIEGFTLDSHCLGFVTDNLIAGGMRT